MLKERYGCQELANMKNTCMLTEMTPPSSQRDIKEERQRLATDWRHEEIHFIFAGSLLLWMNQEKPLLLNKRYKPLNAMQLKPGIHSSVHLMKH